MSALSETDLAGLGLKTPPPEPTRFVKESRSFAAGLFLLLALFGIAVVGCRALPNPWEIRTVQTTDPKRYEEFAHQWPKVLPGHIPTHATNVKFGYDGSLSFRSYETITLGVTLPAPQIESILAQLQRDGARPLTAPVPTEIPASEAIRLAGAQILAFDVPPILNSSHYDLVVVSTETNRVLWISHRDSG
jgi:hypothetical protein